MLSIEQCRGARGILGWTQQDLADASGLSKTAINNFEKGHSDIKAESLKAIRLAFESADIEFSDNNGIRKKSENMEILRGMNARNSLLEDMQKSLSITDKDILIISSNTYLFDALGKEKTNGYIETLKQNKLAQRVLLSAHGKEKNLVAQACRFLPEECGNAFITTYIYGSKVAFELWENSMIVIISSSDVNAAERGRFEHLWNNAQDK